MLRGVGATSKETICAKKSSMTGKIHNATHFAVGCKKWDEDSVRGQSRTHTDYPDHQVVYATCDAPDKNASVVELRQQGFRPDVHYRTEQRERFDHPGAQPLDLPYRAHISVHLGDDQPGFATQQQSVHRPLSDEARRSSPLLSAGQGALEPNSVLPRPPRPHVIHGGGRSIDNYDLGVHAGHNFNRYTANSSAICYEANTRNPILGHHIPHAAMHHPHMRTTADQITEANATQPTLRSLGALRPG